MFTASVWLLDIISYYFACFSRVNRNKPLAIICSYCDGAFAVAAFFGIVCSYFFAFAVIFRPCASFLEGAFAAMFFAFAISPLLLHSFAFAFFFGVRSLCVGKMSQFSDFCLQLVYGY